MAIDPRIALGVQQPAFNNPFAALSDYRREREEAENRKRLTDSRVAADQAAIAENQAQTEAIQQKLQREQAEAQALQAWDGTPEMLQKIVGPERGQVILKGAEALREQQIKSESALKENIGRVIGGIKALPTEDLRQHWYETVVSDYAKRGWIKPDQLQPYSPETLDLYQQWAMSPSEQAAAGKLIEHDPTKEQRKPSGELVTAAQAEPAKTPATFQAAILAAKDPLEKNRLIREAKQFEEATRAPAGPRDTGPLETIIGPDGKPIRVPRDQAIGKSPASGTEKPSSGQQKRVLNFFNRAEQADKELENLESQIQSQSLPGQVYRSLAPNFAQTQLGQSYEAAQRAFTEARLRKDSGAAIPPAEFENDKKTYFAQTGDSKETLEQKRRARAAMLASLAFESGQALGEFIGDPQEAAQIIEGYKSRASGKDQKTGGIKILKIEQVP